MDLHILALETSSSLCGVALLSACEGQLQVRSMGHDATGEHAERLLPMVDTLLEEAGIGRARLNAIAFGQGPGGFTGLRVACGVAQGIAYALNLPVIPVPSLLAVAEQDQPGDAVRIVLQDARMNELYAAAYRPGQSGDPAWQVVREAVLLNVHDAAAWLGQLTRELHHGPATASPSVDAGSFSGSIRLLGDALAAYPVLAALGDADAAAPRSVRWGGVQRATAEGVVRLAYQAWLRSETIPPAQAAPLYVRDKVAYTMAERESGLGGNPKAQAPIVIEPMRADDLQASAAIEASVQAFPWTLGNFRDALEAGYGAWVARQGGRVVGFSLVLFAPDIAHLLLIAVSPDAQRKGVGYALLRHCEQETLRRDLPALMLEVRPSNEQAVAFYRNRGFVHTGTRKGYYPTGKGEREDAWVMERPLKPAGELVS